MTWRGKGKEAEKGEGERTHQGQQPEPARGLSLGLDPGGNEMVGATSPMKTKEQPPSQENPQTLATPTFALCSPV